MRPVVLALAAAGCGAQPVHLPVDAGPPDMAAIYDFSTAQPGDMAAAADLSVADTATAMVDAAGADLASNADLEINYCVVQFPKMTTVKANMPSELIYGQVYQAGLTDQAMNTPAAGVLAQVGVGPVNSDPRTSGAWKWIAAVPNPGFDWSQNNDEYEAQLTVAQAGNYWYAYRFSVTNGAGWTYCDTVGNGNNMNLPVFDPAKSGQLTVN